VSAVRPKPRAERKPRWYAAWLAPLLISCVGVPSPLAPGLRGTVGVPHLGVLTDAVELPVRGVGYQRYRVLGKHYWGLPRLVRTVEAAAGYVARVRPGGAPLLVGDLSARYGGKIQGHNSHRSGRDVDLLYYVTTPRGVPIASRGFTPIDGDTLGFVPETGEYVRLDLPRQWELVTFLITSPDVGVQFLFMSRSIEALLIEYALSRGEPLEVIDRAQTVLLQPTDSMPHDDHMHLRIACAPDEGVTGCSGGGPYWQWLPKPESPLPVDTALLAQIARDDPWPANEPVAHSAAGAPGGA
jgi:penicillin-insensitive murein DD-endopeptidase